LDTSDVPFIEQDPFTMNEKDVYTTKKFIARKDEESRKDKNDSIVDLSVTLSGIKKIKKIALTINCVAMLDY